mmetsp:Transcript_52567/g.96192  ORF Transcript_52567/g.96192 Transcript_52567/m.96192 type:complete len:220 (-) Transcript_52567:167-826(-)
MCKGLAAIDHDSLFTVFCAEVINNGHHLFSLPKELRLQKSLHILPPRPRCVDNQRPQKELQHFGISIPERLMYLLPIKPGSRPRLTICRQSVEASSTGADVVVPQLGMQLCVVNFLTFCILKACPVCRNILQRRMCPDEVIKARLLQVDEPIIIPLDLSCTVWEHGLLQTSRMSQSPCLVDGSSVSQQLPFDAEAAFFRGDQCFPLPLEVRKSDVLLGR